MAGTNYETWNVALWLSNDEGTDAMLREWAVEAWEEAEELGNSPYLNREERATRIVADQIQEYVEDNNPLAGEASMYSDILSANLHEVNWGDIAQGQIEEVDKEAEVNPMTQHTHTPGPWVYCPIKNREAIQGVAPEVFAGPVVVARAYDPFGEGLAVAEANARLVAVAPAQHKALVLAEATLQDAYQAIRKSVTVRPDVLDTINNTLGIIQAAIAKVTE